ncbi:unnamed protein product [Moneuplotes crassus]|uniref:Protein kinase domain-containing protein n=1 Tax=Euplotes crassus TaxID=5936 RepID=A0AAD1XPV1_EUPCR|nr:unnamed protein product [Moneuplotes crassus]
MSQDPKKSSNKLNDQSLEVEGFQPQNLSKNKAIDNYVIGKTIGEGTFGKVRAGTHILTGDKVAVKILEKDRISDVADVERVSREIHILKLTRHHNIIQLYEIIETKKLLYLIMEYADGGELFDYIVNSSKIDEREACHIFQQIISGIEYIHKLNVVHRDMKPENLLIDNKKTIKIVDFGLSNTFKKEELLKTACGSPCYAAPEMIAGKKYYGPKSDIWSCGVILYALVCGFLPFEDNNTAALYKKIMDGEYVVPDFISKEAQDIIVKILNTDPEKRLSVEEIKNHAWFKTSVPVYLSEGLIIGYNRIPIQNKILSLMTNQGFDPKYIQRCIDANKHNHCTTTYYIFLKKLKLIDKLEVIKEKICNTKEEHEEEKGNIDNDPTANIIDSYLMDDISDRSFCKMNNSKKEDLTKDLETEKVDLIYKAISHNLERSRLANNKQFQTENKNYDNTKITLNLDNTYNNCNEISQSQINYSNFKSNDNSFSKSYVHTLENTMNQGGENQEIYQDITRNNINELSFETNNPHNNSKLSNLAMEYMNNISGYDLLSEESNSIISNETDKEDTKGKPQKSTISETDSQKKIILNKKLLNYHRKTSKINTSVQHYNSKNNGSIKSRKHTLPTKGSRGSSNLPYKEKKKLQKCISQNFKEYQSSKSRSASRKYHGMPFTKSKKYTTSKNSKTNIGKMFNLAVSSCSKMLKKMKKGKSPGTSKTRAPTRCSPYKQNMSNISMYQPSFDPGFKKPSSNRNPGLHSKGRKCLINTTFSNDDKGKLAPKASTQKGEHKFSDKLQKEKKSFTNTKQDGIVNLYSKGKKNVAIMQAPTTVNNNACIIVNQSIVLQKNANKGLNLQTDSRHKGQVFTTFNSKKGSKDGTRSKSKKADSIKKKSPKVPLNQKHNNLLQMNGTILNIDKSRVLNSKTVRSQARTRNQNGVKSEFYSINPKTLQKRKNNIFSPNFNIAPSTGALPEQSRFMGSQVKINPAIYSTKDSYKKSESKSKEKKGKSKFRIKRSRKASFSGKRI